MNAPFKLYGAELSPYSVKVRSYLRFKGLDFEWLSRSNARAEEFARYAKLPLVPVLVGADDVAMQDSTPIIEALESANPEPSIVPEDSRLAFLAALIEDYADEWLNKAMFHYRWSFAPDRESASKRIMDMLFEGAEAPDGIEEAIGARMAARLHHVGSSAETAPIIEGSFTRVLDLIEALLKDRLYLFGGRPTIADFGLAGQLRQLSSDPTPGAMIAARAPRTAAWIERMEAPRIEGGYADFETLRTGLSALLREEIARTYLPWMAANAQSVADDDLGVSIDIDGGVFTQKPQRYAAKAFNAVRARFAALGGTEEALAALLDETGCASYFAASASDNTEDNEDNDGSEDGEA